MTGTETNDVRAWEAVYRRLYPKLHAYSRRRLSSDHEADDVVAEVMARAVAGDGRFGPRSEEIDGWLFGICRNVLHERHRALGRDQRWQLVGASLVPPSVAGPLDLVLLGEEHDRLVAALARLEPDEREVLELRVTAELDADQVGKVIGKRPGAVRMAQARALARLRTFMEEVT